LLVQSPLASNQPGSLALNRQDDAANEHHAGCELAPVTGLVIQLTPQAASRKPQAASRKPQAASRKPQAASRKPQAASRKPQAASRKPQAWPLQICEGSIAPAPPFKKAGPF